MRSVPRGEVSRVHRPRGRRDRRRVRAAQLLPSPVPVRRTQLPVSPANAKTANLRNGRLLTGREIHQRDAVLVRPPRVCWPAPQPFGSP